MVWGGRPRAGTQGPLEGQQHQRDEKGNVRAKGWSSAASHDLPPYT